MPTKHIWVLLMAAVSGGVMLACGGDESEVDCYREAVAGCSAAPSTMESPEAGLAARYAPVLYLREQTRECDRAGGAYEPRPVEIVLENPEVALRQSDGRLVKFAPTARGL